MNIEKSKGTRKAEKTMEEVLACFPGARPVYGNTPSVEIYDKEAFTKEMFLLGWPVTIEDVKKALSSKGKLHEPKEQLIQFIQ
jgi:hypothetical protein